MRIAGRIEVGMALVVANGAEKELAPTARDPLACLIREPHAFTATTGTILRRAMRIDFDAHYPFCIGFFFRELVDFAFELVGLFAIAPPGFAAPLWLDRAQAFKEQHAARILLADLDNGSCRFVRHIQVVSSDMCPHLSVAPLA